MDFTFWLIAGLFLNLALSLVALHVASEQGRNKSAWFFVSFLLGSVFALLALAGLDKKTSLRISPVISRFAVLDGKKVAKCESCREWIDREASICKYCRSSVAEDFSRLEEAQSAHFANERKKEIEQELKTAKYREKNEAVDKQAEQILSSRFQQLKEFKSSRGMKLTAWSLVALSIISIFPILQFERQKQADNREFPVYSTPLLTLKAWSATLYQCGAEKATGDFGDLQFRAEGPVSVYGPASAMGVSSTYLNPWIFKIGESYANDKLVSIKLSEEMPIDVVDCISKGIVGSSFSSLEPQSTKTFPNNYSISRYGDFTLSTKAR